MKKIIFVSLVLLSLLTNPILKAQQLSSSAEFSLITVSPGEELYSCFGHSAFLLQDSTTKIYKMYNYGVFDFEDPNFYSNFTRGKLKYMLNVEPPAQIVMMAEAENRSITMQTLNLSAAQRDRLYAYLENNALPKNRYYKYDFFYDNCSSRLRDALVVACGDSLNYNLKPATEPRSFRGLIDPYLENKRWQDLGMDLGLGRPADSIATPYQYMFLPDYLMNGFDSATLLRDGKRIKLVRTKEVVMTNTPNTSITPFYLKPWFAFWLLFGVVLWITLVQHKKQLTGHWLDFLLFGISGLFGCVLLFLWFGTDHAVTVKNYNLIWANPLPLIALVLLLMKKGVKRISSFFLANFFTLFFLLLFWAFVPQELNAATIPFLMALALRSMYIYYRIDIDFVRWRIQY